MVIDIEARILVEQPRNCGSIPGKWKTYNFSPNHSDQPCGPYIFLSFGIGKSFSSTKRLDYEAHHLPPSSVVVRNEWSYYSTPQ